MTLSGATTPGQRGPGSNDNKGVLNIPLRFNTGTSRSDCLLSYPGHLLGIIPPLQGYNRCIRQIRPTRLIGSQFGILFYNIYVYRYHIISYACIVFVYSCSYCKYM